MEYAFHIFFKQIVIKTMEYYTKIMDLFYILKNYF